MIRTSQRPLSLALALAMTLTLLAVAPSPARAHDSCAVAQPAATGLLGTFVAAINVFAPVLSTEVGCEDKYEDVEVKMTRDWQTADADPAEPRPNAASAAPGSEAPRTFAPCRNGMAAEFFPCDGIDMLSHVSHEELGTTFVNDIWGWTDPTTGHDYALVGASNGTVFVDITDAKRPEVLGIMPTASTQGGSSWRDIKVHDDHAYVVSEHTNHGVQVFDLTRLRGWDGTYTTYEPDTRYTGHGSAHNIAINEDTGFAYSVGAGPFSAMAQPFSVTVDEPSSAAGTYLAAGASFGEPAPQAGIAGTFVVAEDADGGMLACGPVADLPADAIAVVSRGLCPFADKAANVQDAGAVAVVVVNDRPGEPTNMGGANDDVVIPAVMISQDAGGAILSGLPATGDVAANDPPSDCGDGLHIIDINQPKSPTYAGCFQDHGYVHDTQCVIYDGPDAAFQGREICFNSNGIEYALEGRNFLSIVDVTDKQNPVALSQMAYEGSGYSHQGWLTEDQRWFLHGDEGDEILDGVNTTTRVWDVSDLRDPQVHEVFVNDTTSIDHNLYIQGRYAYASNYTTGLRVYDVADLADRGIEEVAYFDMYPENDNPTFEGGTWSNYPYFRQKGVVAVSSIDRGLFILQPRVSRAGN